MPGISFPQPSPEPVQHSFAQAPQADIERSTFNLSHAIKLTCDASMLVPFHSDEMLPGETRSANFSIFGRLLTPLFAPMDNLYIDTFFFFVPFRLLWTNWTKFCGEQETPGASTAYTVPCVVQGVPGALNFPVHSLGDYFGHPVTVPITPDEINAWQWRAYATIFNKWFRDENLQAPVDCNYGDGPDALTGGGPRTNNTLLRRGRRKDYFTSALPWPQKGAAVLLPLGTSAPVRITQAISTHVGTQNIMSSSGGGAVANLETVNGSGLAFPSEYTELQGVADLSLATSANINDIRLAFQLQKLLERDARGGTRYPEVLRSHFGVVDPMLAVLQFPQYLGGGETPITTVPIPQTSSTVGETQGLGSIASYQVIAAQNGHGYTYSATEHGILMGILCVRADQTYSQGVNRKWTRKTRYDFYWPVLAHLGEQEVLNKELYYDSTDGLNDEVFGYQERWAEYRYTPSMNLGLFRPQVAGTLATWHYGQHYTARPNLNDAFIQDNSQENVDRTVAVQNQPQVKIDIWGQTKGAKPMPVFSVPGLVDHF